MPVFKEFVRCIPEFCIFHHNGLFHRFEGSLSKKQFGFCDWILQIIKDYFDEIDIVYSDFNLKTAMHNGVRFDAVQYLIVQKKLPFTAADLRDLCNADKSHWSIEDSYSVYLMLSNMDH